jgi:hypothetical protein
MEHNASRTRIVTQEEIIRYLPGGEWVKPVAGEEYTINQVEHRPEATLQRPVGDWPKGTRLFPRPGGYTILFPDGTVAQSTPNPY